MVRICLSQALGPWPALLRRLAEGEGQRCLTNSPWLWARLADRDSHAKGLFSKLPVGACYRLHKVLCILHRDVGLAMVSAGRAILRFRVFPSPECLQPFARKDLHVDMWQRHGFGRRQPGGALA